MGALTKHKIDAATDSIKISDGTNTLAIDGSGDIGVTFTRLLDSTDSVAIGDGAGLLLDILTSDAVATGAEEGFMPLGIRQDAGGSPVSATSPTNNTLPYEYPCSAAVLTNANRGFNPAKINSSFSTHRPLTPQS